MRPYHSHSIDPPALPRSDRQLVRTALEAVACIQSTHTHKIRKRVSPDPSATPALQRISDPKAHLWR